MRESSTLLRMSAGILVWGLYFGLAYGLTAALCARGGAAAVPWVIAAVAALAAAAAAAIVAREWRRRAAFASWLAAGLALTALVAIAFGSVPVWFLQPCA